MTSKLDTAGLVERGRYIVENPSTWDAFDQGASDIIRDLLEALTQASAPDTLPMPVFDALAQEIRRVDGDHSLGAVALAEALAPFLASQLSALQERAQRAEREIEDAWSEFGNVPRSVLAGHIKAALDELAAIADAEKSRAAAAEAGVAELEGRPDENGFVIGHPVEKFTGEARWEGTLVASYLTTAGKRRYVVEVHPQGFQMIAVPAQLRMIAALGDGGEVGG